MVGHMQNDNVIRDAIEERLLQSIELGADTEEALAETAGLLAEAEAAFVRLSHPRFSLPPPVRSR
jgi:hypothetical protein